MIVSAKPAAPSPSLAGSRGLAVEEARGEGVGCAVAVGVGVYFANHNLGAFRHVTLDDFGHQAVTGADLNPDRLDITAIFHPQDAMLLVVLSRLGGWLVILALLARQLEPFATRLGRYLLLQRQPAQSDVGDKEHVA